MAEKGEKSAERRGGSAGAAAGAGAARHTPRDAQVLAAMLKELGVTEHEPRVLSQLLELSHRYVSGALEEARALAAHAKKKQIDLEDVRLAVQSQLDRAFTTPPPRELLVELARARNVTPLPPIKAHCGLRLPPDRYCLSACNYRLKAPVKKTVAKSEAPPAPKVGTKPGAMQGSVVKRQGPMPSGPPKTPNAPKPLLKFYSSGKVVAKPAIRVTSGPAATVKMEVDADSGPNKRKRDDDYDNL